MGVVVKVDASGRVVQANEGMELATGLPRDALVGLDAFYFGNPARARSLFQRSAEMGSTTRDNEMEIIHAAGFSTPVSVAVVALRGANGAVSGATFICKPKAQDAGAELVARKASVACKGDLAEGGGS